MSDTTSLAETFYWMKLAHLVRYAGARSCDIICDALRYHDWNLEKVFTLSEPEFRANFPEFGRGRYARLDYANFHQNIPEPDELELRRVLRHLRSSVRVLSLVHPDYPTLLRKQLGPDAPPLLYAEGHFPILSARSIAVIGSRRADPSTLRIAAVVAEALADEGYNVVSGFARGVDCAAHRAALRADGTTTLVLPRGIQTYLMKRELRVPGWQRNHLVVSQFHPLAIPRTLSFQMRNRTLVGLSEAVVVIDANGGGGTTATANFARKQGVPVLVLSPERFRYRAYGNMDLIGAGGFEFRTVAELIGALSLIRE